jgi:sulfite exporter TauE/SafE
VFSTSAFGGTSLSATPVGGVGTVNEPDEAAVYDQGRIFGYWSAGKMFGICGSAANISTYLQVFDLFVKRKYENEIFDAILLPPHQ